MNAGASSTASIARTSSATGEPACGLDSVTVIHRNAAVADAAATALLVAGPQRWQSVAAQMGIDQALVIDHDGRRTATRRLAGRLLAGGRPNSFAESGLR